jgi:hypothetical protein
VAREAHRDARIEHDRRCVLSFRAIEDALVFNAFSSEYIAHLLESRAHTKSQPMCPLSLARLTDIEPEFILASGNVGN